MYLGNSRILQGRTTNENAIGEWLAIAPEGANSGTYGLGDTSSIASQNGVYSLEMIQGKLVVGGNFTTAYNGSGTTSCWRISAFDGTEFISIKYNGSNEQGLTHSELTSTLLRFHCACYTMRGIYGSNQGEKDHILIGGYFNKVGNKNKNHLAKINASLEFEDTLTASDDSLTGWVTSINTYTNPIDVNTGGLGQAESANTFAFLVGNGLTDGDGRASYVGERILIYKYDNGQETLLTDVNGVHPLAGMVDDSDELPTGGGKKEAFQTNSDFYIYGNLFPNLEDNVLKIYLNKVVPRDLGSVTDSFEGSHFYKYNVYDKIFEASRDSVPNLTVLMPSIIPIATSGFIGYGNSNNCQDSYMLYKGKVLSSFRLTFSQSNSIYDHTELDYYIRNSQIYPLNNIGYDFLNQVTYGGKSYIFTGKITDPNSKLTVIQDIGYDKDLNFPDTEGTIETVFIDPSDNSKTIYVGGTFEFTDKNGVTAKNVAKFVPSSAKI